MEHCIEMSFTVMARVFWCFWCLPEFAADLCYSGFEHCITVSVTEIAGVFRRTSSDCYTFSELYLYDRDFDEYLREIFGVYLRLLVIVSICRRLKEATVVCWK